MANISNQWSAEQLTRFLKSTLNLANEDLPLNTNNLEDWLNWPAGKGGKYLLKIANPQLLYKGDIIIQDPTHDYVAIVAEGGSVSGKYKVAEGDSTLKKFIKKDKTGPVKYVLRWKGAFNESNTQTGDGSVKSRALEAVQKMWNSVKGNQPLPSMYVCGIRGFYNKTNKRGIYDDAICVFGPGGAFAIFKANVDPSGFRAGVASLLPGVHPYKPGNHGISRPGGGYPAFRPATVGEALPVSRTGKNGVFNGIAINIHKGGNNSTSSLGCQTIQPTQWTQFYALVRSEMSKVGTSQFNYILCDTV